MNQQDKWYCNDCGYLNLMARADCWHCKAKNPMPLLVRPKISNAKVLGIVAVAAICVLPFAVYLDSKKPLKNTDVPAPAS